MPVQALEDASKHWGLQDSSSPFDRTESLMFLAHFVGDVHQPLHCGHTDDLGTTLSSSTGEWYRRKSNLHHVWDVNVIETAMKDFYNNDLSTMIKAIQRNITDVWSNEEKQWETCNIRTKFSEESSKLACNAYKGVKQDSILQDDYFFAALPVVQKRIAQGGVRLAVTLNKILRE
ncbi:endonuclease 2-like [Panicum virgatum]|uniref:endonuclease 2-like n=1 Tax=Panicum virgatum TaxID=38727 RepID=UPI0019D4FC9E|nr:endonuclease 2-like [Panicum virgatum]